MAQTPKKSSTAEIDVIVAIRDWLKTKEPAWTLNSGPVGVCTGRAYSTLYVGNDKGLFGWIDGPYKEDLKVLAWGHGAGHEIFNLIEPESFEKIHEFLVRIRL